ncbi:MAG: enoyl-CoA hydratase/isomerase family protein [Armatimonadetes bacterium]|nr:enoyl-CoA hydratase/isomerase family protein [Armatimonadota bacterium]
MVNNEGISVVVIGAGTMGSGIAAHLCNLGFAVTLLDLTRESCEAAVERAKNVKPAHFYGPDSLARLTLGGIDTDLGVVANATWVCEAIIEKPDAKKALYEKLEPLLPEEAIISTNTSGLEIQLLAEGRSESFRRRFLGTHFFNPPRYLKLLELIPTNDTDPGEVERVKEFLETRVGRRVVIAKDTPGFIANRFGMWAMFQAVHVAEHLRLRLEDVDAMTGPFLGRPRSASFRLNDLVGMDIMVDIAENLKARCPSNEFTPTLNTPRSVAHLIQQGSLGQKSGRGYYLREGKSQSALDLETLLYRDTSEPDVPSLSALAKLPFGERIREALKLGDDLGEFLRRYLIPTLRYADSIKEEISHSVLDFDRVMMWGFGWQLGPFAMIDAIGPDVLGLKPNKFYDSGSMRTHSGTYEALPEEPQYRSIQEFPIIEPYGTFNIRDLGDGAIAASISTKMGSITPEFVREFSEWVAKASVPFVLTSEAKAFSVGYDLNFFVAQSEQSNWEAVTAGLAELQNLAALLRTKQVICAIFGYCLGAGLEIAASCSKILAHPETQIGLPEAKVGLLPGGGGTALMALRSQETARGCVEMAVRLSQGLVGTSAAEAKTFGYLRPTDLVAINPDSLTYEAAKLLPEATPVVLPAWKVPAGPLAGMIDDGQSKIKDFTRYDNTIADHMKFIFCKATSWDEALALERERFITLLAEGPTQARIKHMLEHGKPLRN